MKKNAAIAQLAEHQFPKLKVAGSIPVCRSKNGNRINKPRNDAEFKRKLFSDNEQNDLFDQLLATQNRVWNNHFFQ